MTEEKKQYAGTKGMSVRYAVNRVYELMEKAPLGNKEQEYYKEAQGVIESNLDDDLRDAANWRKVKEKLTAKQLLHVLEGK